MVTILYLSSFDFGGHYARRWLGLGHCIPDGLVLAIQAIPSFHVQ